MGAFVKAAELVKPVFTQGSFVCKAAPGLPFLLEEGMQVHVVPPVMRGPRQMRVVHLRPVGDAWRVELDPAPTSEQMDDYAGRYVLAWFDVAPTATGKSDYAGLEGFAVKDEREGYLGEVAEVLVGAAQDLLVVEGPRGQVLIPAVPELVADVDEAGRVVRTQVPNGLVELGADDGAAGAAAAGAVADDGAVGVRAACAGAGGALEGSAANADTAAGGAAGGAVVGAAHAEALGAENEVRPC